MIYRGRSISLQKKETPQEKNRFFCEVSGSSPREKGGGKGI